MKQIGYPKPEKKKPRRKHRAGILAPKDGTCYLCRMLNGDKQIQITEEHHIFFRGGQRWKSEEDGLKVQLCMAHHREGPEAVHKNARVCRRLQAAAQKEYEKTHTREDFVARYGKNYIYFEEVEPWKSLGKENEENERREERTGN